MERMGYPTYSDLELEIQELEEENRKLKEESYNELQRLGKENFELREENKRLKEKLEKWEKDYKEGIIVHCRNG